MGFCKNILPSKGKDPLKTEPIDCVVSNQRTGGVTVSYPAGYYQFKLAYTYQQFDRSNENIYYRDSVGTLHWLGSMGADDYGYSPYYSIANLILDLSLFESAETLKKMTSFSLVFGPNSRDPHFNSFSAVGLRKIGGGSLNPYLKGFFRLFSKRKEVQKHELL